VKAAREHIKEGARPDPHAPTAGLGLVQIALDIGATKIAVTLIDHTGQAMVSRHSTRMLLRASSSPQVAIGQLIKDVCQERGVAPERVGSVVIGVPGVLDRRSGTVASCPNLPELDGKALGRGLSESLGVAVRVENDVNLIALGEATAGRGRGIADVACVFVGSGIGCGLILGGELYVGADGTAGEFGHTIVEPNGRLCTCGNRGCLEMYCSGKALSAWAAAVGLKSPQMSGRRGELYGAEGAVRAASLGDPSAQEVLNSAFTYLGLGVSNLVNIMNPRLVILGGGLMNGWPRGMDRVRDIVKARSRLIARDRVEIDGPVLGDGAFAIGAARLAADSNALNGAM
jgi:glucokinase